MFVSFVGRRRVFTGAVGASLLLLAGCSADSVNSDGSSDAKETATLRPSVGLRLPLQDYLFSDSDLRTVKQAMRVLTKDCMRRYKVSYDFGPIPPAMGPAASRIAGTA